MGPDGRQYVAIYSGVGGNARVPVDKTLAGFPAQGGTLYVFSIDGDAVGMGAGVPPAESGSSAKP
jgi:hypothetical protein